MRCMWDDNGFRKGRHNAIRVSEAEEEIQQSEGCAQDDAQDEQSCGLQMRILQQGNPFSYSSVDAQERDTIAAADSDLGGGRGKFITSKSQPSCECSAFYEREQQEESQSKKTKWPRGYTGKEKVLRSHHNWLWS